MGIVLQNLGSVVAHPGRSARRLVRLGRREPDGGRPTRGQWVDVWTRTHPRYRRRAIILLLINCVLFFGLGCFTFWLRSGETVPFLVPDYWEQLWNSFRPVGEHQVTLADFLLYPITVSDAPIQIFVLGLLLASLVTMPILVAMLYRFPFALIFIAIVGFVAMLPWLAITLLLSCALTSVRPFRFSFRFATALIALIPVAAYFVSASRNPVAAASYGAPIESALYHVPSVVAILASCLVLALVLLIARIVDYRPGAIAPMLAVMFAMPVGLFEAKVGRDELYYRLLENEYGPHARVFRDEDASTVIRFLVHEILLDEDSPQRDPAALEQEIKLTWRVKLDQLDMVDRAMNLFAHEQYRAVHACDEFRADYPRSRFIPNVLYLKGRALDMRVDLEAFRHDGTLRFYQSFPSENSAATWRTLYEQDPTSPLASVALLRLARLEARAGRIDHALELLAEMEKGFGNYGDVATRPAEGWLAHLQQPPATANLDLRIPDLVAEARKFQVLLATNRDPYLAEPPDIKADAPLVEFLRCDPRHRLFAQNVRTIRERFPMSRMQARLRLEEILTERSTSLKIRALEEFIRTYSSTHNPDAMPEALYRLGTEYLLDSRPHDAAATFRRLAAEYSDSPWVPDAQRQLAELASLESLRGTS